MVKPKIFWRLRRLEAGLSGFKIKRVHYDKFGLQIIREPPYFSDPNTPLPFTLNTGLPPPSAFFVFVLLLLRFPATLFPTWRAVRGKKLWLFLIILSCPSISNVVLSFFFLNSPFFVQLGRFPASISGDGELRRGMEDAKQVYVSSLSIIFSPFLQVERGGRKRVSVLG